jgi:anti-anti-sigma factor
VTVRGEIDHDGTGRFSQAPRAGRNPGTRIVAILRYVTFMDSSGIGILVAPHRRTGNAGGWPRITAAQESVLRPVGLDAVVPCHPTVGDLSCIYGRNVY